MVWYIYLLIYHVNQPNVGHIYINIQCTVFIYMRVYISLTYCYIHVHVQSFVPSIICFILIMGLSYVCETTWTWTYQGEDDLRFVFGRSLFVTSTNGGLWVWVTPPKFNMVQLKMIVSEKESPDLKGGFSGEPC